ncbi:MAG: ROK family protein [Lentisphaerae bacterium]|nr:ROK family protein [Lentisphaerota bacterium]
MIDRDMRYAVGIDLGGTSLKAGIVSAAGDILVQSESALQGRHSGGAIVEQIGGVYRNLVTGRSDIDIAGVGIGISGCVSPKDGTVTLSAKIPQLNGFALAGELAARIECPVFVDNSSNNAGRAEEHFGAAKGVEDFFLITIGTGIGGAVFVGGQLVVGVAGFAGEVGHMSIVPDGRRCRCGGTGCWEAYGSARALREDALLLLGRETSSSLLGCPKEEVTPERIIAEAKAGDTMARNLVGRWCRWNAIGIANLINLLNSEVCVVGGGASAAGSLIIDQISEHAQEFVLPCSWSRCRILSAKFMSRSGLVGSAALVLQRTRQPVHRSRRASSA